MFGDLNPRVPSVSAGRTTVYCSLASQIIFPTASCNNGMQALIGYTDAIYDDLGCWDPVNFCYRVKKPGWYFVRNAVRAQQTTTMEILIAYTQDRNYVYKTANTSPWTAIADSPIGVSYYSAGCSSMCYATSGDSFVPTAYSPVQLTQAAIMGWQYGFSVVGPF